MGRNLKTAATLGLTVAGIASGAGWFTPAFWKTAGIWALGSLVGGGQRLEGARLTDLGVQVAQEAAELARGWGYWRQAGVLVYCPGLTESESKKKHGKGGSGVSETTFHYTTDLFIVGGIGPITNPVGVKLNNKIVFEWNDGAPKGWKLEQSETGQHFYAKADGYNDTDMEIRFYTGHVSQPIDALFEAAKGVNKWTNYPGLWGLAIKNFYVSPYGGQIPNVTFEVYNEITQLDAIVREICCRKVFVDGGFEQGINLTPADLDLSEIEDIDIAVTEKSGFVVSSRRSRASILRELGELYRFDMCEVDGVLVARRRGGAIVTALVERDLRQYNQSGAGEATAPMEEVLPDTAALPDIQEIQFYDAGRDCNPGFRFARAEGAAAGKRDSATYSWITSGNYAERQGKIILADKRTRSHSRTLSLGPGHLYLAPGDDVTVEARGDLSQVNLSDVTLPFFGAFTAAAVDSDPLIEGIGLGPDTGNLPENGIGEAGEPIVMVADTSPLTESDPDMVSRAGVMVFVSTRGAFSGVNGRIGKPDPDSSLGLENDIELFSFRDRAVMGQLLETYYPGNFEDGYNPDQSAVVEMFYGNPDSRDVDAISRNGGNIVVFENGLVCQFVEATEGGTTGEGGEIWTLSTIIDGRWGSDFITAPMAAGTKFVILTDGDGTENGGMLWVPMETNQIGREWRVRAATNNESGDRKVVATEFFYRARNMEPPSPSGVRFVRDGAGGAALEGAGRTRIPHDGTWESAIAGRMSETPTTLGFKYRLRLTDGENAWEGDKYTTDPYAAFAWSWTSDELLMMEINPTQPLTGHVALYGQFGPGRERDFDEFTF
jgi:hypothetical protein